MIKSIFPEILVSFNNPKEIFPIIRHLMSAGNKNATVPEPESTLEERQDRIRRI